MKVVKQAAPVTLPETMRNAGQFSSTGREQQESTHRADAIHSKATFRNIQAQSLLPVSLGGATSSVPAWQEYQAFAHHVAAMALSKIR